MGISILVAAIIALITVIADCANAKEISINLETEVAVGENLGNSFSQYVFFHVAPRENPIGWNGYMRYFDVSDGGPKHGEFVFGPTFNLSNYGGELQTNIVGFTTDGSYSFGGTLITSIGEQTVVFITDPKIYLNKKFDTLFQKLVLPNIATIYGVPIDIRAEHLFVNWNTNVFLRVGPQVPIIPQRFLNFLGKNTTMTVSPFYEIETGGVGSFFTLTLRQ